MKFVLRSLAAVSLVALATPAFAQVVNFNRTLDLNNPGANVSDSQVYAVGTGIGFSSGPAQTVAIGDQVNITFMFGGNALSTSNINGAYALMWDWNPATGTTADGKPGADVNMTGTFSFLDAGGNSIFTVGPKTDTNGNVHVGQVFSPFSFNTGAIQFFGVKYSGVLNSSTIQSRMYNLPALYLRGDDIAVVNVAAGVPEPATWAMMIMGFGMVGATMRKRQRVTARYTFA